MLRVTSSERQRAISPASSSSTGDAGPTGASLEMRTTGEKEVHASPNAASALTKPVITDFDT